MKTLATFLTIFSSLSLVYAGPGTTGGGGFVVGEASFSPSHSTSKAPLSAISIQDFHSLLDVRSLNSKDYDAVSLDDISASEGSVVAAALELASDDNALSSEITSTVRENYHLPSVLVYKPVLQQMSEGSLASAILKASLGSAFIRAQGLPVRSDLMVITSPADAKRLENIEIENFISR